MIAGEPLPVSFTFWGVLLASSLTLRIAVRIPRAVGWNVIVIAHCCPGDRFPLHVSEVEAKSPATVMEEIVRSFLVGFASVTIREVAAPIG